MDKILFTDSFLYKTGERIIPGAVSLKTLSEHYARYIFARKYCDNNIVLNVASGCGYGSEVLIGNRNEVYNVDISENLTAYGNKRYGSYKNHFLCMDAQNLRFPDAFFDVVVSFETIEHLPHPKKFIKECHRVLKNNGILILSTPNKIITSPFSTKPYNQFHYKEWDFTGLRNLFRKYFMVDGLFGQNFRQQQKASYLWRFNIKLLRILIDNTPGFIFKIIKKRILGYKAISADKIRIEKEHLIKKATEIDFALNSEKYSYGVFILVLKKIPSPT